MLTRIDGSVMLDLADIDRVGEKTIKMASGEGLRSLDTAVQKNPMLGLYMKLVGFGLRVLTLPSFRYSSYNRLTVSASVSLTVSCRFSRSKPKGTSPPIHMPFFL